MPFWSSSAQKDDVTIANEYLSESFALFNQGLCYDEMNDDACLQMYEQGLALIEQASHIKGSKNAELWQTMQEAKPGVQTRIAQIKKLGPKNLSKMNDSPIKNDVVADSNGIIELKKEVELEHLMLKNVIRSKLDAVSDREAELVYFLPHGVQLFMINGEETAAPTYPTSLEILRFRSETETAFQRKPEPKIDAFIQVGPWVYPLMGDKTPILRNEYGAYVVPNPTAECQSMMVAIMLPSDLDQNLIEEFEYVLNAYADLKTEKVGEKLTTEERKRLSEKIAHFLVKTGEQIADGVHTTTAKVASKVEKKNSEYRSKLTPTAEPLNISPAVKTSVVYMHKGGKLVAKCTRYLLDKIGDMGVAIGRSVISGAKNTFDEGKTGGVVTGTITVIGGGITSVSTVWIALEDASRNLCRSIANETVENVRIKYGQDAAETTHHALYATGHSSLAAVQLWDLGPRSVAGRMARKAGLQIFSDLHRKRTGYDLPKPESQRFLCSQEKKTPL